MVVMEMVSYMETGQGNRQEQEREELLWFFLAANSKIVTWYFVTIIRYGSILNRKYHSLKWEISKNHIPPLFKQNTPPLIPRSQASSSDPSRAQTTS